MSLKEIVLQKNFNSILLTDKNTRNSQTGSLTNLSSTSTRRQTACADNLSVSSREISKILLNKNSSSPLSTLRRSNGKKQNENISRVCHCSDCSTPDEIPKHHLQELEDQLQELMFEINKQKSDNLILKRHILVAKKVVKNEVGVGRGEAFDFDNLLKKVCGESWMGRHEMIFVLKRKLEELNEIVEHMESEVKVPSLRKSPKKSVTSKREESQEIFPDERTIYWCLEQERQGVWRNAERDKQKIVESRDAMRSKLDPLVVRNEGLMKETISLRKKLSIVSKNADEGLVESLHGLESSVKMQLEEKAGDRRSLDDLEQQVCRNSKTLAELKEKIRLEKQILEDTEARIKSLNENEAVLNAASEEKKRERHTQMVTTRNSIEMVEQNYSKIATKSEQVIKLTSDGKRLLEGRKPSRIKDSLNTKKSRVLSVCELRVGSEENNKLDVEKGSEISIEMLGHRYEDKLERYKSMLEKLEHRNQAKLHNFYNIANKTKDDIFTFLRKRYVLWKLATDTDALKSRLKKHKKSVHPPKQKLTKRKEPNQLLIEILNERKTCMAILKIESKLLKMLIRSVFGSREDDCELLESFVDRNRDHFLKASSNLKAIKKIQKRPA